MMFLGDFLYPFDEIDDSVFNRLGKEFIDDPKILNFESTLSALNRKKLPLCTGLFSSDSSLRVLQNLNVKCVALANNHVTDFDYNISKFLNSFININIFPIGFGGNILNASEPFICDKENLIVLNYGWKTIKCVYSSQDLSGVNPYDYKWVEKDFMEKCKLYPNYKKVLFLHWNYEFENLPLPADRMFAHHMIDMGVDAIIGHHPHVINPLEIYKDKPIFYSLGNFYFPQVHYGNVKVSFRESALKGISVSYSGNIEDSYVYLHQQIPNGKNVKLLKRYSLMEWYESEYNLRISLMSDSEYLDYYRKNHFHKNKLLPIYKDYRDSKRNAFFDAFVAFRQHFIDMIKK